MKPPSRQTAPITIAPIAPADEGALNAAVQALRAGALIGLPTETVYGLAADAANDDAITCLYEAKGRPRFNPLIAHVADGDAARRIAVFNDAAQRLADAFWPGPLTLVLPHRPGRVCALARAGLDTIAVRAPAHPIAQVVLQRFGGPLAAPSANPSGAISPTRAIDVQRGLGAALALILDGGATSHGVESTIVALIDDRPGLLRPGPITADALEAVLQAPLCDAPPSSADAPQSPGQLARHYAPKRLKLRLNARDVRPDEIRIGFGAGPFSLFNLSPQGDLREAARTLFSVLRALDDAGFRRAAVAPIPEHGLGVAINDRLRRAASNT